MASTVKFQDLGASSSKEGGLAATRQQRKNAGNKMSKLLAEEVDDDEFYKTALGGFEEDSEDDEYVSEDEVSDQIDSDFSVSETDEVIDQDDDEEDGKRKRKKTLYKEPKRAKVASQGNGSTSKKPVQVQSTKVVKDASLHSDSASERRKSSRALTVTSSEMHRKRMEKKRKVGKKQVKFSQARRLTQQELLAEAKITEELNIESLKAYQQMEESKKKTKNIKPVRNEAMIRYLSVTMPLIEPNDDEINIEDDGDTGVLPKDKPQEARKCSPHSKCSRNFIIFTDPKTFPGTYFSTKKVPMPQKAYCPVTGLPAKYMDPVTGMSYATTRAFRYIRAHYSKQEAGNTEKLEKRTRSGRKITKTTSDT